MLHFWKPFRVAVSLLVLISIAFVFVDFRQQLPSHWYKVFTWFQFIPSAREFFITFCVMSAGFIIVLLLTLLFGRVYCSTICPLGILQDIVSYISKKLKKKEHRYKFALPKNWFRYTFLAIAIIPLVFGTIMAIGLLDPYSNFGRIFSDLMRPIYLFFNNVIANTLINFNVYSVAPEEYSNVNWITLIYPVIVFSLIVWLAYKWGRLYCNTVCPVGTDRKSVV